MKASLGDGTLPVSGNSSFLHDVFIVLPVQALQVKYKDKQMSDRVGIKGSIYFVSVFYGAVED